MGAQIALAALDRGDSVVIADDLSTGFRESCPPVAAFEKIDIRDGRAVAAVLRAHKIDRVIHAAAVASVPQSTADPARCFAVNVEGTKILAATARANGVRALVFSSTSAVYDDAGAPPFAEDAPKNPQSPYAQSKWLAENALAEAGSDDFRVVVLRYFNVAGADPDLRAGECRAHPSALIPSALEAAAGARAALSIFGDDYPTPDGSGVRDYIHIADIADAHAAALDFAAAMTPRAGGETAFFRVFNLGLGRGFSALQIVAAVKRVTGVDFEVVVAPRRAGDPASIFADPTPRPRRVGVFAAPSRIGIDHRRRLALAAKKRRNRSSQSELARGRL